MSDIRSSDVKAILRWREKGQSCRDIAERLGVKEWQIHNLMKKTGNAGRWRAPMKPRPPKPQFPTPKSRSRLDDIVSEYGSVYVERGSWAGYIATIDDKWTGSESVTVDEAIRSAIQAAQEAR